MCVCKKEESIRSVARQPLWGTWLSCLLKSVCPSAELWLTWAQQSQASRRWEVGKDGRKKAAKGPSNRGGINTPTPPPSSCTHTNIWQHTEWVMWHFGRGQGGLQGAVWQHLPRQREAVVSMALSAACCDSSLSVQEISFSQHAHWDYKNLESEAWFLIWRVTFHKKMSCRL